MKIPFLISFLAITAVGLSQNYSSLGTDNQGDSFHIDAKELFYFLNSAEDTLFIKVEHHATRTESFGFVLALDTNLNPADGFSLAQNNMFNQTPNNSLKYDLALYAYEFSNFPGIQIEAYGSNGNLVQVPFGFDTSNAFYSVFSIPLSSIGGNADLNLVAFTGTFTISPGGSGPSDALPDNTFIELRASSLGLNEQDPNSFRAYPNPATSFIIIENGGDKQSLLVYDFNGRIVREIEIEKSARLNTRELPKGLYFLKSKENKGNALKIAIH